MPIHKTNDKMQIPSVSTAWQWFGLSFDESRWPDCAACRPTSRPSSLSSQAFALTQTYCGGAKAVRKGDTPLHEQRGMPAAPFRAVIHSTILTIACGESRRNRQPRIQTLPRKPL